MASQQVQFAETIRAMKLALKRRADDSDSDTPIPTATNRGHKRLHAAQHVHQGRLDNTGGRAAYRKKVEHAGYKRYIISTNPTLYDPDGDVVSPPESDDEHHHHRDIHSIRDNAFGEVRLEQLLRPLTAAGELPEHPSLSLPYTSRALTQMAEQAQEMVRKERERLWQAKMLLRRFRGDADWVPCESFEAEQDEMMLLPGVEGVEEELVQSTVPSVVLEAQSLADVEMDGESAGVPGVQDQGLGMNGDGVDATDMAMQQAAVEAEKTVAEIDKLDTAKEGEDVPHQPNGDPTTTTSALPTTEPDPTTSITTPLDALAAEAASEQTSNSGKDNLSNTHAMTTRARARSPQTSSRPSPTPSNSSTTPQINPWFLHPSTAQPDRDLGLPGPEAEETRRMLLLYVQKQEHVVRQLHTLSEGLLQADRLRRDVYLACKAEGHVRDDGRGNMVTEMSDGEDWYDPADWGMGERDLKMGRDGRLGLEKGRDEVEEGVEEEARRGGRRRRVNRM